MDAINREKARIAFKLLTMERLGPPQSGYITVVCTDDPDVVFVPDEAALQVIEGTARGNSRAVKVTLIHDGQETVGWVDRKLVDWHKTRKKLKKRLEELEDGIRNPHQR